MKLQPYPFPPPWASGWGTDRLSPYPFVELELAPGVSMRLRWVPPGRFFMGSPSDEAGRWEVEGPQHGVTITRGFWLADAPCTQTEWVAVMGEDPSHFKGQDDSVHRPVENVSWDDCQTFFQKLAERFPGLEARLPTEAEWEYACRAGTESAFNDGSPCTVPEGNDPALAKLGWFGKNSGGTTHPVRELQPNRWGLYDLHGNVWEWCADWFDRYGAEEQRDPTGPASGQDRVLRGGGWYDHAWLCRSAYRFWFQPDVRFHDDGFRLAAVQPAP
ncbi:MAG: formylglycine-generating enzyme family protein [Polyangiaceae bacterium]|nr:formylglycine-generating enzyme family protein [Polyangiaceae bacterium]